MRVLSICLALAAGEFAASFALTAAEAWPVAAVAALLVALFGHGLAVRGWQLPAVFLVGAALFLAASVEGERQFRESPWMRQARRRPQQEHGPQVQWARSVKLDFARRIGLGLEHDREVVALNRAILLGERKALPRRTRQAFVDSGTMHVFAISGLHVMAVASVLVYLLAILFVPRRIAGAAAVPILWGYVYLIGASPSAVRAALMATFYYSAPLVWRRPNGLRSWELAFLTVHLIRPTVISDVGNALSFSVMLAIVLVGERCRASGLKGTVLTGGAAWAAGVPIAAHVFGCVTPGGMLANLVLIFAAKLVVVSGLTGVLVSYVSVTLAVHLNNLAAQVTWSMVGVSEAISRLPGASFEVGRWSLLQCAEWYVMIVLVGFLIVRRGKMI